MNNLEKFKQHYQSEYHGFIREVNNKIKKVEEYTPFIDIGFLNKLEIEIVNSIAKESIVKLYFKEIYTDQEKIKIIIYNQNLINEKKIYDDYEVLFYEIKYNQKFAQITHSQVLGTFLNNDVHMHSFGDIVLNNENNVFFISDCVGFEKISHNIFQIANCKIKIREVLEIHGEKKVPALNTYHCKSLRVDSIVKTICKFKREKAKDLIQKKEVRINYQISQNLTKEIKLNDIISVRRYGKFQIKQINGKPKGFVIIVSEEV